MEAILDIPSYLDKPREADHYYGTLTYDDRSDSWVIEGEPIVCQMAKRLFPGAEGRGRGVARFKSNKRTNGDLNWLMMRYPLQIKTSLKWNHDYKEAVKHIVKRNEFNRGPQKLEPSKHIFTGTLEEFQKEGVAFLKYNAPCLCADDMGLGKTVEAIGWIALLEKFPGLIIAPPSVQLQWKRELMRFIVPQPVDGLMQFELFPDQKKMVHIIKGLTPYELPPALFYVIHYGLLRGWKQYLPSFGFEFIVFDEIQELRHANTDKYSAASLLAQSTENVIGLSGTPIYGKGAEIQSVMNILDYQCLGDKESFSREWCAGYGSEIVVDPEMLGQHLRREGLMIRRTKDQIPDLPKKRRIVQAIDMDESHFFKQMKEVIQQIMQYDTTTDQLEKGRLKREIAEKVRRETGVAKAPYVASFVKMLLDADEPVVLYGYHHEVYGIWTETLRAYNPVFVTGRESPNEKERSKEKFISGGTNLIIISLRAAAGIDGLQHRANINVFGELDWSPGIHSQCEDRTHRKGQNESVLSYYLVCSEGSDEQMMEALGFKVAQFMGIIGGEEETEQDKAIAQIEVGKHLDKVIERLRGAGSA